MNGEKAVVEILSNDPAFYALVGGSAANARVYYEVAPQTAIYPHCVVTRESTTPNDTKQNSDFDADNIQVFMMAESKLVALQMGDAARSALTQVRTTVKNGINVNEIRFIDSDSFDEKIVDQLIYTEEHIYRVLINS